MFTSHTLLWFKCCGSVIQNYGEIKGDVKLGGKDKGVFRVLFMIEKCHSRLEAKLLDLQCCIELNVGRSKTNERISSMMQR